MKLWRIKQNVNNGYDTYDSAVVAAETADEARKINVSAPTHPYEFERYSSWAKPEDVTVEQIGEAREGIQAGEIICASFNAG